MIGCLQGSAAWAQQAEPDFPYARPYFHAVGSRDDIPSGIVSTMIRAPDGLIWIGTQTALLRFDGYRFRAYEHDPGDPASLPGNLVAALTSDAQGRIWVGTANDGLGVLDPATGQFRNYSVEGGQGLQHNSVGALLSDAASTYIGTASGLQRLDYAADRFETLRHAEDASESARRVRVLLRDQRRLWIGAWDGLWYLDDDQSQSERFTLPTGDPFAAQAVNALALAEDGALIVGTREHGLSRIAPDRGSVRRISSSIEVEGRTLATDRIQSIVQAPDGALWVATTVGLYVLEAEDLAVRAHYLHDQTDSGSLAFDALGALTTGPTGMIWIGSWGGGVQRIDPDKPGFRSVRADRDGEAGLSFPDVHAVLELDDGSLWVGTGGNGIDILHPQRGRIGGHRPDAERPGALRDGVVIALAQDPQGRVWVGTQRGGVYRSDRARGGFTRLGEALTISNILVCRDGTVYIGGNVGLQRLSGTDHFETMLDSAGDPIAGQIIPLLEDSQGRVWAGSASGLRMLAPGESAFAVIEHEPERADSLIHNSVYGLMEDRDGQIWVATEQGIDRLRSWDGAQAAFDHVSRDLGAPGLDLGANLMQDRRGRIWTDTTVFDLDARRVLTIGRAEGLDIGTIWFGAHRRMRDGRLLLGGTEGLAIIDPEQFQTWDFQPPVVATELRINGLEAPVPGPAGLQLAPDQRAFSLQFAALDMSAPQQLRYQYRLRGFDDTWIQTDAEQRRASYSNLWPGEYLLEVRGSNRLGDWSEHMLSVPVQVLPRYWQTPWFVVLVLTALALLLLAGMRWRTRQLRRRSAQLDQMVRERTQALADANAQLLAANGDLRAAREHLEHTQAQLVFQEKMASLGQLVAGVAHEVNTPLGVAITASSYLSDATRDLASRIEAGQLHKSELLQFAQDSAESSQLLSIHLARAAALVRQFKQVSVDRAQDGRRQVRLSQLLEEVMSSLEPLWKRLPITVSCEHSVDITVDSYPGAIGQVLTNLVQNAINHAFPDGREGCLEVRAQVSGEESAAEIVLEVRDDGVGMDQATRERVFEPFFTTSRSQGGTGLGLHIVFNIVTAQLGGTIEVRSEPGQGACFVVRFPARFAGD